MTKARRTCPLLRGERKCLVSGGTWTSNKEIALGSKWALPLLDVPTEITRLKKRKVTRSLKIILS